MIKETYELNSFNELTIHGYKWKPDGPAKAALLISHGMAETIERYERFAHYLNDLGVAVYGHSHRGHGKTAGSIENLGILGENGWFKAKEDLKQAVDLVKNENPNIPVFVMGHSMGSFLSRDFLLDYSETIDGCILSGTGFMPMGLLNLGGTVSNMVVRLKGPKHKSKFLDTLSFGSYNKRIKPNNTSFDWLSRDPSEVEKYIEDPYCGNVHSASFFRDFLNNLKRILYTDTFKNKRENLPLFILSGTDDPVGGYKKGVLQTEAYYKAQNFDVSCKLYEGGRHEMLNEINRLEVYEDIRQFIFNHID